MLGIITDGDIRRVIQKNVNLNTLVAEDIMTKNPISITQETLAYDALQIMEKGSSQISVLPVIDGENKYLGLIRIHDIIGKL
jgi:arabinose-5-phosphate isomerase